MRNFLFVGALALGLLVLPGKAAGVEDEIRKAEEAWSAAVAKSDAAAVGKMLSDKLIYAHSTGLVDSKSDYLTKMKSGAQKYDAITYSNMKIVPYGDAVIVHANVRMVGATKGEPFDNKLMMMHTWVKQGGHWLLVAHQTTRLP